MIFQNLEKKKPENKAFKKHESTKTVMIDGQHVEVKVYPKITSDLNKKRADQKLKALKQLNDLFKEK